MATADAAEVKRRVHEYLRQRFAAGEEYVSLTPERIVVAIALADDPADTASTTEQHVQAALRELEDEGVLRLDEVGRVVEFFDPL